MTQKPVTYGVIAAISLLALYATIMTLFSGRQAAVEQFLALWYLMVPLAIGFGVQVGLYTMIKKTIQKQASMTMATSGTVSGAAMLACCAHHVTDLAPFLGLAGLSIFLAQYQVPILTLGIGMNIIGIIIMRNHLKKISL